MTNGSVDRYGKKTLNGNPGYGLGLVGAQFLRSANVWFRAY